MFCYGEKESWYKKKVPSGMLPAIEIDGEIVTESDDILFVLEVQHLLLTCMYYTHIIHPRKNWRWPDTVHICSGCLRTLGAVYERSNSHAATSARKKAIQRLVPLALLPSTLPRGRVS